MKKLPIALQVYSIREEAEKNFVSTMQEVKSMGYDGVELAGLYGRTPEEIRDILKDIGLTPVSAHVAYEEFITDLKGTVRNYAAIGCRNVAIPYLTEDYRYDTDNFRGVMKNIPMISKACREAGITLLYHNHDFEFSKTTEGEYVLDYMYRSIPEEILKAEIDTCWVKAVGVDPVGYLRKYSGRCPVIHLKDFNGTEPFEFRAVGHGVQDIPSLLSEAVSIGCDWIIVEQDGHTQNTPMEDMRISREYLKKLGW